MMSAIGYGANVFTGVANLIRDVQSVEDSARVLACVGDITSEEKENIDGNIAQAVSSLKNIQAILLGMIKRYSL